MVVADVSNVPLAEAGITPPPAVTVADVFSPNACDAFTPNESLFPFVIVSVMLVPDVCVALSASAIASFLESESDCDCVPVTDSFSVFDSESVIALLVPFCIPALAPTLTPTVAEEPIALFSVYVKLVCHEA